MNTPRLRRGGGIASSSSLVLHVLVVLYNTRYSLKKNQNAPRPSEHPPVRGGGNAKRLGGIKGCKYKTSSWHINGFPDGINIGSTV